MVTYLSRNTLSISILNRPGFPGKYFIFELRLPDHHFRWKHNILFQLLPEGNVQPFRQSSIQSNHVSETSSIIRNSKSFGYLFNVTFFSPVVPYLDVRLYQTGVWIANSRLMAPYGGLFTYLLLSAVSNVVVMSEVIHPDTQGNGYSLLLMCQFISQIKTIDKKAILLMYKDRHINLYTHLGYQYMTLSETVMAELNDTLTLIPGVLMFFRQPMAGSFEGILIIDTHFLPPVQHKFRGDVWFRHMKPEFIQDISC
ncbi:TPA: hypothetical protein ACWP24_004915 [Escherichia coli]|nr:hypothetical protein [Escherichia coli]HCO9786662.1 hypothetical protein [Escherichia coli]